mmetsp:Transcript_3266/g.6427  ORF Transcript_3266/g.6427 Transcript_3266/m.6427 type:complete len:1160 (+) Transcript_3266:276-3755(+)
MSSFNLRSAVELSAGRWSFEGTATDDFDTQYTISAALELHSDGTVTALVFEDGSAAGIAVPYGSWDLNGSLRYEVRYGKDAVTYKYDGKFQGKNKIEGTVSGNWQYQDWPSNPTQPANERGGFRGVMRGPESSPLKIDYILHIATGDRLHADTDASLFVQMSGSEKVSLPIPLHEGNWVLPTDHSNRLRPMFQRSQTDAFAISVDADIGKLVSVQVACDAFAPREGMFLKHVVVEDTRTGLYSVHPCNQWLDPAEEDGDTVRSLRMASYGLEEGNLAIELKLREELAEERQMGKTMKNEMGTLKIELEKLSVCVSDVNKVLNSLKSPVAEKEMEKLQVLLRETVTSDLLTEKVTAVVKQKMVEITAHKDKVAQLGTDLQVAQSSVKSLTDERNELNKRIQQLTTSQDEMRGKLKTMEDNILKSQQEHDAAREKWTNEMDNAQAVHKLLLDRTKNDLETHHKAANAQLVGKHAEDVDQLHRALKHMQEQADKYKDDFKAQTTLLEGERTQHNETRLQHATAMQEIATLEDAIQKLTCEYKSSMKACNVENASLEDKLMNLQQKFEATNIHKRTQRHMDEKFQMNKKIAALEDQLKDLEFQLSRKQKQVHSVAQSFSVDEQATKRRKELQLKHELEAKYDQDLRQAKAEFDAQKHAEISKLKHGHAEKLKHMEKRVVERAEVWARKEVSKVKAHTQKYAEDKAAMVEKHLSNDGMGKAEIQHVLQLETNGWHKATIGQQILRKHHEIQFQSEELSKAIARCLKARDNIALHNKGKLDTVVWSAPSAAEWTVISGQKDRAQKGTQRTSLGESGEEVSHENKSVLEADQKQTDELDKLAETTKLVLRTCRQATAMLDRNIGCAHESVGRDGAQSHHNASYSAAHNIHATQQGLCNPDNMHLHCARAHPVMNSTLQDRGARTHARLQTRPKSASQARRSLKSPYTNIHINGSPAGMATRSRPWPYSTRPTSALRKSSSAIPRPQSSAKNVEMLYATPSSYASQNELHGSSDQLLRTCYGTYEPGGQNIASSYHSDNLDLPSASQLDAEHMAASLESGGCTEETLGEVVATSLAGLNERVESLLVECTNVLQRLTDLKSSAASLGEMVRSIMMPPDWTNKNLDTQRSYQWVHDLVHDERSIGNICSCIMYNDMRYHNGTLVADKH